ncbi:GntR family transcriptional regulator [Marinobacter oulmenensis]|uniref:DNA-binding GntR family transcriptional regulator n=1 Tax=Marinobacter oulmenensis TaxID=643747 RepID=A0A840U6L6_9GAMM|nr:GntR family transcriptional regulator [Marinobacter oulmenensis]MBB5321394.1 DNA-binding GntR family transcriptional regulator [Marinobacter oulmenensis]
MSRSSAVPESSREQEQNPSSRSRKKKGLDAVYRSVADAIIEHRLKPGARLREDALAEVFGISRTGVRKVLQRLAMEQLVTLTPRRGASVTRPSVDEAKDVFEARQMVECALMETAARRVTAAEIRELREMDRQEREALRSGEQRMAIKLSAAFHSRLASLSGNTTLADFVGQLCSRSSLILAVYGNSGHLGCESHDHGKLIDLIAEGEGRKASDFMERHLKSIEASLSIDEDSEETPDLKDIFRTAAD